MHSIRILAAALLFSLSGLSQASTFTFGEDGINYGNTLTPFSSGCSTVAGAGAAAVAQFNAESYFGYSDWTYIGPFTNESWPGGDFTAEDDVRLFEITSEGYMGSAYNELVAITATTWAPGSCSGGGGGETLDLTATNEKLDALIAIMKTSFSSDSTLTPDGDAAVTDFSVAHVLLLCGWAVMAGLGAIFGRLS